MLHMGHPILNDPLYGQPTSTSTSTVSRRFALHAYQLSINHPIHTDIPMVIQAPYAYTTDDTLISRSSGSPDGSSGSPDGSSWSPNGSSGSLIREYIPCHPLVPVHGDNVDMGFTPYSYNQLTDHTHHIMSIEC